MKSAKRFLVTTYAPRNITIPILNDGLKIETLSIAGEASLSGNQVTV
jgi:hypothetical protein